MLVKITWKVLEPVKSGVELTQNEAENLHYVSAELKNLADIKTVKDIFKRILEANKKNKIYQQTILEVVIGNLWLQFIIKKPTPKPVFEPIDQPLGPIGIRPWAVALAKAVVAVATVSVSVVAISTVAVAIALGG